MIPTIYKPVKTEGTFIPQKEETMSWDRMCLIYGRRLVAYQLVNSSSTQTVYTVPQGYVFLLLTAEVSIYFGSSSGQERVRMFVFDGSSSIQLLSAALSTPTGGSTNSISISPAVPMLLRAGEGITLSYTDSNYDGTGHIFGYEIPADIFYKLI